ncbi:hypothetical protein TNCV_4829131 [Trichonephila clavipes]|nr:hypothetical protein TNCV_4829131 [Trichonephila clavipes]
MEVTWCKIRTVWRKTLPSKSMVLRCRYRVWFRIVIQQQNARFEMSMPLFPKHLFQIRQGVTVLRNTHIDGSNLQNVQEKVNASSEYREP